MALQTFSRGVNFICLPLFKQLSGLETAQPFNGAFPRPFMAEARELGVFIALKDGLFAGLLHAFQ